MSSRREVTAWGAGSGPEGGEGLRVLSGRRRASRGLGQGLELGAPRGDGQGGPREPEGLTWELEVPAAGGPRRRGRRAPPGSPAQRRDDAEDLVAGLGEQEARGRPRNPSPEGGPSDVAAIWAGLEAGPGGRGPLFQSCVELQPAAGLPCQPSGPAGAPARGLPHRGRKGRWGVGGDRPWRPASPPLALPSDRECQDDGSEIHLMRVSIYSRGGGPASAGAVASASASASGPDDPADTGRPPSFPVREGFVQGSGSLLAPGARGLGAMVEWQAAGEPDVAASKRMQGAMWAKAGGRPGLPEAAGVAGVPLPRAFPRRKVGQVRQALGPGSEMALGRTFPPWGQRVQAAPPEPASFPPIAGVQLRGSAKKQGSVPSPTKQSKRSGGSGKKSGGGKPRELEPVAVAEDDPDRGPAPKGQRPRSSLSPYRGEGSSRDRNTRVPQALGIAQPLVPSWGDILLREPTPSDDQEPPGCPPSPAQSCPRCVILQKEIDDLREQLAAKQSLADEFQTL